MLNKNQSNKRNYWKYALVLPLLGAFVFFFQIQVVAQEKVSAKTEINNEETPFFIVIDKNKSDKKIKESSSIAKSNYDVNLKFSKIKRNSNGEIIAIKAEFTNKEGSSGATEISGTKPIKTFLFYIKGNEIGFEELKKSNNNGNVTVSKAPITDETIATSNYVQSVKITDKDIYIDGVKATNEEFSELDPNAIDKVNVDTFENNVKITTKKINISADNFQNKTVSKEKPIIILNGIRTLSTLEDLNKLDPNLIQSMNVLKGKSAIEKYGKNGENGAIEIITKKAIDGLKLSPTKTIRQPENIDIPSPPTPPTPPAFTLKNPKPPVFPKAPKAPKGDPINGDKKAWKEYESRMEEFNKKMEALKPQMKIFEKKMEEFDKQMEPVNALMEDFDEKMKIFHQQMDEYQSKINVKKGK